jgi:hypothetical protein
LRYQVFISLILFWFISQLSAMNCEYINRFGESNTSLRLNNTMIENEKLYLCKEYGIDIFNIEDNGELSLINTIIMDDINNFTIHSDNLYFACRPFSSSTWETVVYKYDISDPLQPVATGQMDLDYPPHTMYIWQNMLTVVDFLVVRQLSYYDLETLEFISSEEGPFLKPFYENYWCTSLADSLAVYDLSDPFNAVEVASVDLEGIGNVYSHECKRINDDLYVILNQHEMSLWNTSDFSNWQLISQFPFPDLDQLFYGLNMEIWEETIILPLTEELIVVDISDPELPQVSQILNHALFNPTNCLKHGDYIYLIDNYVGIQVLNLLDNTVQIGEVCTEFPMLLNGLRMGDNLIRETYLKNQETPDVFIWNTSNPGSPHLSAELELDNGRTGLKMLADILVLKNEENLNLEFYDISSLPDMPYMGSINCFSNQYEFDYGDFYIFESETDRIYVKTPPGHFVCYDVSYLQNPEMMFEITETNCYISDVIGDYIYLIEPVSADGLDLIIYSGNDNNDPQLAARYLDFLPENCVAKIYHNKLFISDCIDYYTTQVYLLSGSEVPEFLCNLSIDFGGRLIYYGGEYIVCSILDAYGFYIPENPPIFIEPSFHIGRFNFICNLKIVSSEAEDYLYVFDTGYTEVYQIESTLNDKDLIIENIQMITYPNPFSFVNGQELTFYPQNDISRYGIESFLSVYNIKGQLIHNEYFQPGKNEINWDCYLDNGYKAPSGVYFFKVECNTKSEFGKFIITK